MIGTGQNQRIDRRQYLTVWIGSLLFFSSFPFITLFLFSHSLYYSVFISDLSIFCISQFLNPSSVVPVSYYIPLIAIWPNKHSPQRSLTPPVITTVQHLLHDTNTTMADKELTFAEVSEHTSKKDLYLVVHDKVYDCSSFVDEHP